MKNFKKLIACIMAVATLGSVTCISANAVTKDIPSTVSTYNAVNPMEYVRETFESNVEEYLKTTGIDEKIKYSAIVDKEDDFSSKYDFLYYTNLDKYSLASFGAYIRATIFFESSNPNLIIKDMLSDAQIQEIKELQGENYIDIAQRLTKKDTDENTGLTTYFLYLYLPYDNGNMSYNDTVEYRYNLGKSLIDSGVAENAYLEGIAIYDDYNDIMIEENETDFIIVMNDNIELTNDILGEYADSIQSFEKVTCEDGTTINGATEYYKFTKSEDTEYSYDDIFLALNNNDNIKFAGSLEPLYMSTELWQEGKNIDFQIPILSDNLTIGDSESNTSNEIPLGDSPTGIRGDIDYDGDVDAVDLLLLKKYLLQMITW